MAVELKSCTATAHTAREDSIEEASGEWRGIRRILCIVTSRTCSWEFDGRGISVAGGGFIRTIDGVSIGIGGDRNHYGYEEIGTRTT